MSLFDKAIEMAAKNLHTAGCQYRIITNNGTVLTNIPEEEAKAKRTRKSVVSQGTYHRIYSPVMLAMEPGEVRNIEIPNDINPEFFRAAACAFASSHWGKKTYQTEVNGNRMTVLREGRNAQ